MHHPHLSACRARALVVMLTLAAALTHPLSAQVEFGPERALSSSSWNLLLADFDGDGLPDLGTGSSAYVPAVWLRNSLDETAFTSRVRLTPFEEFHPNDSARHNAADLDGDGDVDYLRVKSATSELDWFENLDGLGQFGIGQRIATDVTLGQTPFASDMDGDGDLDIVLELISPDDITRLVVWYPNLDGKGWFGSAIKIGESAGLTGNPLNARPVDVNGDGATDLMRVEFILGTGYVLSWQQNLGQGLQFSPPKEISIVDTSGVTVADLNGDGFLDALVNGPAPVWIPHVDGAGQFGSPIPLPQPAPTSYVQAITAGDFDGDGAMDLAMGDQFGHRIYWLRNTDGKAAFEFAQFLQDPPPAPSAGVLRISTVDMDADDDDDILVGWSHGKSAWFENEGAVFAPAQRITTRLNPVTRPVAVDADLDGDLDVLFGRRADSSEHPIGWFAQRDEPGSFGALQRVVRDEHLDDDTLASEGIQVADFTSDGHPDVALLINLGPPTDSIELFEYSAQDGNFELADTLTPPNSTTQLLTEDLDDDGRLDLVITVANPFSVSWARGLGDFAFDPFEAIFTTEFDVGPILEDIDEDGDSDLVTRIGLDLVWFERLDDSVAFGSTANLLNTVESNQVRFEFLDVDGDGDRDLVSLAPSVLDTPVLWREKQGPANYLEPAPLTEGTPTASAVTFGDLDADGITDMVFSGLVDEPYYGDFVWWRRGRGAGEFAPREPLTRIATSSIDSLEITDLDGDDDADILFSRRLGVPYIAWLEQGVPSSAITDLGGASPGAAGTPALSGSGSMIPGDKLQMSLTASLPNAPFFLVIGTDLHAQGFLGGVLIPTPDVVLPPLLTGTDGSFAWNLRVPLDFEGLDTILVQAWISDPSTTFGFAVSNALAATVPVD